MNQPKSHAVLALALALPGICGVAQGAELFVHNDLDGDGRSDLVWRNANTGTIVYWSAANAATAGSRPRATGSNKRRRNEGMRSVSGGVEAMSVMIATRRNRRQD